MELTDFGSPQPVNPLYLGIAAAVNSNGDNQSYVLYNDSDIYHPVTNGGDAFTLLCNVTVYDVYYIWLNGSVADFTVQSPSNGSVAYIVNAPEGILSIGETDTSQHEKISLTGGRAGSC